MAFILKSTKFIHSLVGLTRRRGLIGKRKMFALLEGPSSFNFNSFRVRTAVSLAGKELEERDRVGVEKSIVQLTQDIQNRNILTEDIWDVYEGVKQKGEITFSQLILLLKCCSEVAFMSSSKERIEMAEEIWKTAAELGTTFHISHYNALLNVFLENNHKFSPSEFLNMLKKENIEPNVGTYRKILRAYCQQGDIKGANNILDTMKALDYPLCEEDFNSLILGYCEIGDLERAEGILTVMQEKDIDPTYWSYLPLLSSYAKHGKIEKMMETLQSLQEKDIKITDSFLLEIIYALAINGRAEHIDKIIEKLSVTCKWNKHTHRIIQRLLHNNLDSVALKLFEETYETSNETAENILSGSKYIITHCVMYRKPEEALKMCQLFEEKEWSSSAIAYLLKQTFLKKDEHFCINLLEAMRAQEMPVRSHYYWPALIKASRKGNSEMLEILKLMPFELKSRCPQTTKKVVFDNYRFGEKWFKDFEVLTNCGLKHSVVIECFILKLLKEKKFKEVERLARHYGVYRPSPIVPAYIEHLNSFPQEAKRFVNVLYFLAHDYIRMLSYIIRGGNEVKEVTEDEVDEETEEFNQAGPLKIFITHVYLFDTAVTNLMNVLEDKNVLLLILEYMLERGMAITQKTASSFMASNDDQNLIAVIQELSDPELHFKPNSITMRKKKRRFTRNNPEDNIKFPFKQFTSDTNANLNILMKEIENIQSLDMYIIFLRKLVKNGKCQEAVKLAEHLKNEKLKDFPPIKNGSALYLSFIRNMCKKEEFQLAEEAIILGSQMDLIKVKIFPSIIRRLFNRGQIPQAVDLYCNLVNTTKFLACNAEFLVKTVAGKNEEVTRKFMSMMSEYLPERECIFKLFMALAANGELKKAKKMLDMRLFTFNEEKFYNFCEFNKARLSVEIFYNLLRFVKDIEGFDRIPLYKLLITKYAEKDDVESVKKLWHIIEEDSLSNYDFLDQMQEFLKKPTMKNLRKFAESLKSLSLQSASGSDEKLVDTKERNAGFDKALPEDIPYELLDERLRTYAADGKIDKVVELLSENFSSRLKVTDAFLKQNKVKEYLEFLNHYARAKDYRTVALYFKLEKCLDVLEKDRELLDKYKSLAVECYQEGNIGYPLNVYFMVCLTLVDGEKKAEEIFQSYPGHFENVTLHELEKALNPAKWQLHHKIISCDFLKAHFSAHVPLIYSKQIKFYCSRNQLPDALKSLHDAVNAGFKENIDKGVVQFLNKRLTLKGMSFPYPELLRSET